MNKEQLEALEKLIKEVKENFVKYSKDELSYENWRRFESVAMSELIDISMMH